MIELDPLNLSAIVLFGMVWLYGGGLIAAFAWRKRTENLEAAALTFLLLMLPSAYEFAMDEIAVTTPAMQISDAWRAAALRRAW